MIDRRRLPNEDQLERDRRQPSARGAPAGDAAGSVLNLQRAVGNQAVAELLGAASQGAVATVQRDETDTTTATGTMTIPELKLAIPIQSFQLQTNRPRRTEEAGGEVVLSFDEKHFDPRLMKAATDGRQFETIAVQIGGRTITLHKVVMSSVSMGGGTVLMTLNYTSIELPQEGGGGRESEEGRGY